MKSLHLKMGIIVNKRHLRLITVALLLVCVTYFVVAFNGPSKTQLPSKNLVSSLGHEGNVPGIPKDHNDNKEATKGGVISGDVPAIAGSNAVKQKTEQNEDKEVQKEAVFDAAEEYQRILKTAPVVVFSKSYCPWSKKLKSLLRTYYKMDPEFFVVEVDKVKNGDELYKYVKQLTGRNTVPNLVVGGVSRGGFDEINNLHMKDTLLTLLKEWTAGGSGSSITVSKIGENREDQ